MIRNDSKLAVPILNKAEQEIPKSSLLFNHLAGFADSYHMQFTYTIDYRHLAKYMDVTFKQLVDMLYNLAHFNLISFCPIDRAHVQITVYPEFISKANYEFYKDNKNKNLKEVINNV